MLTRLGLVLVLLSSPVQASEIRWQPWNGAFKSAQVENKLVFLYLEAVWCHWCHVMQKKTFPDAGVQADLAKDFVAVRVDHDADPALANRYRNYGWPALVILDAQGNDLAKHAGFMEKNEFRQWLHRAVADPRPERGSPTQLAGPPRLSESGRRLLLKMHAETHDDTLGGLRLAQKFMDRDAVEYSLRHRADPAELKRATQTLDAARALMDPVWGGVYQYSTHGDWRHPHYEKIMRVQASYLRIYALAYGALKREADLKTAQTIRDYLFAFLRSPVGAFYVSQDADLVQGQKAHDYFALEDKARRKLGIPRVDKNLYAQENGWVIEALATLHEVSGDNAALDAALKATNWVLQNRALPEGGFRHGERDAGGPYLGDTLAMGRAFLALYRGTGAPSWEKRAQQAAAFVVKNFRAPAGYYTAVPAKDDLTPIVDVEENISAARFFAALSRSDDANQALRALSHEDFIAGRYTEAGILLADEDLARQ